MLGRMRDIFIESCGLPPWACSGPMAGEGADFVTISLLVGGMAKAGDSPETIKENIVTAREYVAELQRQWSEEEKEKNRLGEIKKSEERIEESRERLKRRLDKLKAYNAEVGELNALIRVSVPDGKEPQGDRFKGLVLEREHILQNIKTQNAYIDQHVALIQAEEKYLRELKGEPEPETVGQPEEEKRPVEADA